MGDSTIARAPAPVRRIAGWLFGCTLSVYLATTGGSFATDLASYEVTKGLVEHGSVAMSYDVLATSAERGVDGRYYAPVGIGHPVFGIPFYAAARAARTVTGLRVGKPESLTKAAVVAGSAFAAAGCVVFAFLLAWRISTSPLGALVAALALAFGTTLWPYAKFGFNAPLAALCLVAAVYWVWVGTRTSTPRALVFAGIALGCAILTRHEMAVAALPIAIWLYGESRHSPGRFLRRAFAVGVPVVIALTLWAWYNDARFGNPLDTGLLRDPNVRFDTPVLVGLGGLLLSPGRSLFVYAPITLVGIVALCSLARRDARTAGLLAALPLVFLPVYATLHQWDGGESYGPRYLVPVLAFLTIPIATWFPRERRRGESMVLTACLVVSIAVQLPGVLVDFSKVQNAYARSRPDYSIALTRYTWEAAPLLLNSRAAVRAVPRNWSYLTGRSTPPALADTAGEEVRDFSQQFAFSLDFWWLYLFYLGGISAPVALGLALGLILLATAFAAKLRGLLPATAEPG